ncbi:hypothetical protein [Paracidobacterium acidisoli]|uniref:Squalene-hopene cyclase n=1 Tax=Paracidobacterium acidisoli TaxID=2303751 RepID=A0A372IJS4_9BACT|nr:hypothetical protein [Paracidobacterium acidisoli]MBT9333250.1 hypothetical protein [Paracidobacterium acidisoli]
MKFRALLFPAFAIGVLAGGIAFAGHIQAASAPSWNQAAAAHYLDSRELWWQSWPKAQRDHATVCVSCHTVLPYALARKTLRTPSEEDALAAPERIMFSGIAKRVTLWNDVEPFYKDGKSGPTKSIESRGTEAVLNALILASYDARRGYLTDLTRSAFAEAWALQRHSGENAGAWIWLNFHNAPWESNESEYHGAALAALAVGTAPDDYQNEPEVRTHVKELRGYLGREYGAQPLVNRIVLLWASARLPGLLTAQERASLLQSIAAKQQPDGGWSLTGLGSWKRRDNTALATGSDGYATGLTVLALEENGLRRTPQVRRGLAWLGRNQNGGEGFWPAWSLNKQRDAGADAAHFMDDAATGYAVLALEDAR